MFEILAAILGLIQGVLVMLNKRSNWLVYAAQMIALVIFSYQVKLYGDMLQNIFYFFFKVIPHVRIGANIVLTNGEISEDFDFKPMAALKVDL